jgi:pentatricopeptide repeat domain-containing protein 1
MIQGYTWQTQHITLLVNTTMYTSLSSFRFPSILQSRCCEAFAAVRRFEAGYPTATPSPASDFTAQRPQWFQTAAALCAALRLPAEVLYDGMLLLDRAMATAAAQPSALDLSPTALIVGCVFIAAQQAGVAVPADRDVQTVAGLEPGQAAAAQAALRQLLGGDTSSISALRVVKLYLERLGADLGRPEGMRGCAGAATQLLEVAVAQGVGREEAPSLLAAAVLLAGRQLAGESSVHLFG